MRQMLSIVMLIIAAAPPAGALTPGAVGVGAAQAQTAAPAQGSAEATLMQIERDATAAIIKRDVKAITPLMADDYVFTGPDAQVQTKAQFIADLSSGDLALEASEIQDMKVRVYGETAVVTYATTDRGTYKGRDIGGRYRWTDVFVRRGGRWQLVSAQGTAIPKPTP
ncbi:MAG: nuclear transport factor 2 family protein [Acidobacteria bacterium]|nr:nuclear transport factor 2 family protein [Acidobacteriota bacterium]